MHNNDDDNVKHYNTKGTGNNNNNRDTHIHSQYTQHTDIIYVWYIMCFNFTPFNCLLSK